MLVIATDKYRKLNVQDNQLRRIPEAGEEFEVSEQRYKLLAGDNQYGAVFVEKVEETKEKEIETAIKKTNTEKAIKKTTKKAK